MSAEDYRNVVGPKAQGSWNLHKHLPKDLDFFVLLASISGIAGTRGQCNYASGNTFQDALARYRISQGLKCISLDLGLMLSVGIAATTSQVDDSRKLGYRGIHEAEFRAMLEYCCDPALTIPVSAQLKSQLVTGLEIPKRLIETEADDGMDWLSWARRPLFRNLARMDGLRDTSNASQENGSSDPAVVTDYKALFAAYKDSVTPVVRCIVQDLKRKLANLLWLSESDIESQRPLHTYGVDSLGAVEIRKWLATGMRADLSIFEIMGNRSLAELAVFIAEKSAYLEEITSK